MPPGDKVQGEHLEGAQQILTAGSPFTEAGEGSQSHTSLFLSRLSWPSGKRQDHGWPELPRVSDFAPVRLERVGRDHGFPFRPGAGKHGSHPGPPG